MITKRQFLKGVGVAGGGVALWAGLAIGGASGHDVLTSEIFTESVSPGTTTFELQGSGLFPITATPVRGRSGSVRASVINTSEKRISSTHSLNPEYPFIQRLNSEDQYTLYVHANAQHLVDVEKINPLSEAAIWIESKLDQDNHEQFRQSISFEQVPSTIETRVVQQFGRFSFINQSTVTDKEVIENDPNLLLNSDTDDLEWHRFYRKVWFGLAEHIGQPTPQPGKVETGFAIANLVLWFYEMNSTALRTLIQGAALASGIPPRDAEDAYSEIRDSPFDHITLKFQTGQHIDIRSLEGSIPTQVIVSIPFENEQYTVSSPYIPIQVSQSDREKYAFEPDVNPVSFVRFITNNF